ncbi:MAG: arsenic efflux protein [Oscillospiraceae bacterium]|nr:arsenic efflux protein [Oscillospiraceae bacterium]
MPHVHEHGLVTEHLFEHIFHHTFSDTISLVPFLFIVFVLLEYMEHSLSDRTTRIIEKAGKWGPLWGSVVGALPQCGFSVMATNLFSGRVVTIGTLVAVYLSTSDEMLAVMISSHAAPSIIFKMVAVKVVIGMLFGFAVDAFHRMRVKLQQKKGMHQHHHHHHHNSEGEHHHDEHTHHNEFISDFCIEEDCHGCEEKPVLAAVKHTLKIYLVIFVVTFLLNMVIELAGVEIIAEVVGRAGIWAPVVSCVVGLIPNCASSVAITQLYLSGAISFGTAMAGLLTGSGIAWIVLFRVNPHSRQNFKIMGMVFVAGALSGIVLNFLGIAI